MKGEEGERAAVGVDRWDVGDCGSAAFSGLGAATAVSAADPGWGSEDSASDEVGGVGERGRERDNGCVAREESTGSGRAVGAACAAPLPVRVDGPVVVFPAKSHTFITPDKAAAESGRSERRERSQLFSHRIPFSQRVWVTRLIV